MRVIKWLDEYFEESILVFFLVCITVVMLAQIVARSIGSSMSWPEEFCRLCWIWSVFLSLPYTIKKGNMLRVNVLVDTFPHVLKKSFFILADIIIIVIMAVMFRSCWTVMHNYFQSTSATPAMQIQFQWAYGIIINVGFGLATLRGLQTLLRDIKNFNVRDLTAVEKTMAEAAEEVSAASGDLAGGEA